MTFELDAAALKLLPKFAEVVNLAIEDDPVAGDWIMHGLVPERREIDDRETGVSKPSLARFRCEINDRGTRIVGSTMLKAVNRLPQNLAELTFGTGGNTEDSTHVVDLSIDLPETQFILSQTKVSTPINALE
jgi:hypothetical protein